MRCGISHTAVCPVVTNDGFFSLLSVIVDSDQKYMQLALRQAGKGIGYTSPNPRVGAVVVKDGQVIARGYHRAYGASHAEIDCLTKLKAGQAKGATLYVNLEPCCHHDKKTPPCVPAIIKAGITRLVYGIIDPNPDVNGQGLKELRKTGIEVSGPVLEEQSKELNRAYIKHRSSGFPWVTLKTAQSLDGRIATNIGDTRWISSQESLKLAHQLRAENDAIIVGIRTALADDPKLNVRFAKGPNPRRVILDGDLRISPNASMFKVNSDPVIIATKPYPPAEKAARLEAQGAEFIWLPPGEAGTLDIKLLLEELSRRGLLYLLVEGGSNVAATIVKRNLFDEMIVVQAPMIIGGDGIPSIASLGVTKLNEARRLHLVKRKTYGSDLVTWFRSSSNSGAD
ncbi:riboflavin biosynthesis protein RibD [candidate division LCP-89 bacterium B3_LCP]|uniref:Riboflavin biosynthesis protein RibD n=1 Tax=candidate division LCP-89 bacterium B3_LCP TaxID=2012998 RepID=A0A532V358_UNCL8|nr:MAG: riboflavin biosynthesis protein RibD [candidate division LCP-89 bacterium B3_LCP]